MPVTRAEASQQVRDAIIGATVRIVAREGVAAVTHRRVATEADVALSSTTWHYATKADILEAALVWTAEHEVAGIAAIAERLGTFDVHAWADELADWLLEQVGAEREVTVALYRLQAELLGTEGALAVHREWARGLRALGDHVLGEASAIDVRLVIAALDGLRISALASGDVDVEDLRRAVRRQLEALLG
ncbi:TetR family transcriptional regulator [Solirubrobacter taibaiensis]|nr:TetR family transcriptional regulator [Solirubrobacter taibaiensis]